MKKLFVLFFCFFFFSVCAENHSFFGGNFSATFANGSIDYGVGGGYSVIGYYGGNKNLYASVGFVADVSSDRKMITDELQGLGVNDISVRFFSVPCRFGYAVEHNLNDNICLLVVPSLACDCHFLHSDFQVSTSGGTVNYSLSGMGYSVGVAVDAGIKQTVGNMLIRYGLDCDVRLFTFLFVDAAYSGSSNGTGKYAVKNTLADYSMITVSPYVAVGFKW